MRISCEDCGKTFSKPTKIEAERAVRMHRGRVHGNIKINTGTSSNGMKRLQTTKGRKVLTEEQIASRRQYQKERRARIKRERNGHASNGYGVHFCANCGFPVGLMDVGMKAAMSLSK